MLKEEKVKEWLVIAEEDLEVAALCFKGSKYLHCAYMCQQAVEKALKSLITANSQTPVPIHDLYSLAEDAGIDELLTAEQKYFLRVLTTYAIAARYPERKKKLRSLCKQEEAEKIMRSTEVFLAWIKEKISEKLFQGK